MKTLLRVLLLVAILAIPRQWLAHAQSNLAWVIDNGAITITGGCPGQPGAVVIPSTISGLPVTRIRDAAFAYCANLTNLVIPGSITNIGFMAFRECTGLTRLEIPDGVAGIGEAAFDGCSNLINVTIGKTVSSIGYSVFDRCPGLTGIDVDPANPYYRSLDGVLFDKEMTTLVRYPEAKSGACVLSAGIVRILGGALRECTKLTAIDVDPANPSYSTADGVLFNKRRTYLLQYPGGRAGPYLVPNGVSNIIPGAFFGSIHLNRVRLPDTVSTIGDGNFLKCTSLTSIEVDPANRWYSSLDGVLFDQGRTTLTRFPVGRSGAYLVPDGVARIATMAFFGCPGLTAVTIGDSVESIGYLAFFGCSRLTRVTIGNRVTTFADRSFELCPISEAFFKGNAPRDSEPTFTSVGMTIYHLPGTTGWGPTFAGRPTAPWVLPEPVILTCPPGVGVKTSSFEGLGFGFRISWATNSPVVVEVTTSLSEPHWSPVSTNTLYDGWADFRDPGWADQVQRFYRVRGP